MEETPPLPAPRPRGTAWQQLAEALSAPGATPEQLGAEATARAQARSVAAPGRIDARGRIVQYSSALEAAVDHRVWLLEIERRDAESRYAAAVDDVDNAFGPREVADAWKTVVEDLRRREYVARELAPIAARTAMGVALADAKADVATLVPDAPRRHITAGAPLVPPPAHARHAFAPDDAHDIARKFEARQAATAHMVANLPTQYSMRSAEVDHVLRRIEKWEREHPKLAALLQAERREQAATVSPQP